MQRSRASSSFMLTAAGGAVLMIAATIWGMESPLHAVHKSWTGVYGHFAHGYLVLGMALWLAWQIWRKGPLPRISPAWLALPALLILVITLAFSMALDIDTATQSLLPLILLAAVAAAYGWHMVRRFFWPIIFLYTALPIWWLVNTPLQQMTTFVANMLVDVTGVPAYVQGNTFHLPAGVMEVAAGCSGLSFFNTAIALALFQGLGFLRSWRDRLKLLGVAAATGLIANWLRVFSLMVIAYATDMRHYLIRVDHLTYGWILFLVCMWPVFWYGARLEKAAGLPSGTDARGDSIEQDRPAVLFLAAIAVAGLLLIPRAFQIALVEKLSGIAPMASLATANPEDRVASNFGDGILFAGAREERATFRVDGRPLWIYRAEAPGTSPPAKWPTSGLEILGAYWQARAGDAPTTGEAGGLKFVQYLGQLHGAEVVLRTGSFVAGSPVSSRIDVKLAVAQGLLKRREDAVLWIASTPCEPECPAAAVRLDQWLGSNSGLLGGTDQ